MRALRLFVDEAGAGSESPLARIREEGCRAWGGRPVAVEVLPTLLNDACPGWAGIA